MTLGIMQYDVWSLTILVVDLDEGTCLRKLHLGIYI